MTQNFPSLNQLQRANYETSLFLKQYNDIHNNLPHDAPSSFRMFSKTNDENPLWGTICSKNSTMCWQKLIKNTRELGNENQHFK